jgi:hypothetical protein
VWEWAHPVVRTVVGGGQTVELGGRGPVPVDLALLPTDLHAGLAGIEPGSLDHQHSPAPEAACVSEERK